MCDYPLLREQHGQSNLECVDDNAQSPVVSPPHRASCKLTFQDVTRNCWITVIPDLHKEKYALAGLIEASFFPSISVSERVALYLNSFCSTILVNDSSFIHERDYTFKLLGFQEQLFRPDVGLIFKTDSGLERLIIPFEVESNGDYEGSLAKTISETVDLFREIACYREPHGLTAYGFLFPLKSALGVTEVSVTWKNHNFHVACRALPIAQVQPSIQTAVTQALHLIQPTLNGTLTPYFIRFTSDEINELLQSASGGTATDIKQIPTPHSIVLHANCAGWPHGI
eukprot:TRINITY_DN2845_c3_g2::TRINITY_DN2845_c3_g2_i1::g.5058::m.5058 TRINITY_DN2845_c3_g2::TRINITY_DN2845_c3_g2_i1::g.5058  ORF type:complete len:284 (-),score=19.01,Hanta_nucleocap/PF00846.13/0.021 TRINITY_DN2845_c3_g2_i1:694-1545(-)